jgi:hypothetical protein
MRRLLSLAAGLALLSLSATAGEYAADYLYLGTGADAAGMAGAWSTSKAGATSFYWNPALVLDEQHLKLYAESVSLFDGLSSYQSAAIQYRLRDKWALSTGLQLNLIDEIPRFGALPDGRDLSDPDQRSDGSTSGSSFSDQSTAITVGLSREFWFDILMGQGLLRNSLPARLALGASWRLLREELDDASASGSGLDVGLKLMIAEQPLPGRPGRRELVLSLARQNLVSSDLAWDTASDHADPLPANTRAGISWRDQFRRLNLDWRLALEHDSAYEGIWRLGTELSFRELIQLRGGMAGETFSGADPTFGVGFKLKHLLVSYAWSAHDLGASHRVAVELRK